MHTLLLCKQNLCTLLEFGDRSDYITTFTRWLETGYVPFLCFYGLRDCFFQIHHGHCQKTMNFLIPLHTMCFLIGM